MAHDGRSRTSIKLDVAAFIKAVGTHGGPTLIVGAFSILLPIFVGVFSQSQLLTTLSIGPALVILPSSFFYFARQQSNAVRLQASIPKEIAEYIKLFPEYGDPQDLYAGYVKTSAESFMYLSREIFESLKRGSHIIATDRLILSEYDNDYWISEGLSYLESNFKSVKNGIKISRYFIIRSQEMGSNLVFLECVLEINALCGVDVYLVKYEDLLPKHRVEFAIFGDLYTDEVKYDLFAHHIIENRIYFSREKHAELKEQITSISHLATPYLSTKRTAGDFTQVQAQARAVRDRLADMRLLPGRSPSQISGSTEPLI